MSKLIIINLEVSIGGTRTPVTYHEVWTAGPLDALVASAISTEASKYKTYGDNLVHLIDIEIYDNELTAASESDAISHTITAMTVVRNEITSLDEAATTLKARPGYDTDQLSTLTRARENLEILLMTLSRRHLTKS